MTHRRPNLDKMIHTEDYQIYENETVMSLQHRIINHRYYNDINLVTHSEIIDCMSEYVDIYIDNLRDTLNKEINQLETWHIENGSIDHIVLDFKEYIE